MFLWILMNKTCKDIKKKFYKLIKMYKSDKQWFLNIWFERINITKSYFVLSIVVIFDSALANDEIKSPTTTKTKDKGKKVQSVNSMEMQSRKPQ